MPDDVPKKLTASHISTHDAKQGHSANSGVKEMMRRHDHEHDSYRQFLVTGDSGDKDRKAKQDKILGKKEADGQHKV